MTLCCSSRSRGRDWSAFHSRPNRCADWLEASVLNAAIRFAVEPQFARHRRTVGTADERKEGTRPAVRRETQHRTRQSDGVFGAGEPTVSNTNGFGNAIVARALPESSSGYAVSSVRQFVSIVTTAALVA
jgi:hypothetical protein